MKMLSSLISEREKNCRSQSTELIIINFNMRFVAWAKGTPARAAARATTRGRRSSAQVTKLKSPRRMGVRREEEEMVESQLGMVVASMCFWPLVLPEGR